MAALQIFLVVAWSGCTVGFGLSFIASDETCRTALGSALLASVAGALAGAVVVGTGIVG